MVDRCLMAPAVLARDSQADSLTGSRQTDLRDRRGLAKRKQTICHPQSAAKAREGRSESRSVREHAYYSARVRGEREAATLYKPFTKAERTAEVLGPAARSRAHGDGMGNLIRRGGAKSKSVRSIREPAVGSKDTGAA